MAQSVWDGGDVDDSLWTSADNWGGTAPVPSTTTDLQFAGTTRLDPTNDFEAASDFRNITFDATAGSFVLGGNAIDLFGAITNNSASLQTIDLDLGMTSGRTFDTANGDITLNGAVNRTGGGSEVIIKTGAGTLTLNGAITAAKVIRVEDGTLAVNTAIGNLTLNGGTVRLDGTDVLGNGSVITMDGGTLDLNGTNDNFRALNGSSGLVTNSNTTTATLNLNQNAATNYGGTIEDGAGVVAVLLDQSSKTLAGDNSYSGGTTLQGSSLRLGSDTALGTGDLAVTHNNSVDSSDTTARVLDNNVVVTGGSNRTHTFAGTNAADLTFGDIEFIVTANTKTLNVGGTENSGVTVTFGSMSGTVTSGTVAKAGVGTLVMGSADSTLTGNVRVDAGTLAITGEAIGDLTVNAGTLDPGNGIGTFEVNNATFADNSTFAIELGAPGVSDLLVVNGNLDLSSVLNTLSISGVADDSSIYTIATYTGTLTGTFDTITPGYQIDYGTGTNSSITLVVPEPASLALLGLGGLMIVGRRRRARVS